MMARASPVASKCAAPDVESRRERAMNDNRDPDREAILREIEAARAAGDKERERKALEALADYDRDRGIDP